MSRSLSALLGSVALPLSLITLTSCAPSSGEPSPVEAAPAEAQAPVIAPWGYPMDAFDDTVRPGDDFFQYANGGWLAATEIPSDRSGTGFSITMVERNEARIAEIIADIHSRRALLSFVELQSGPVRLGAGS